MIFRRSGPLLICRTTSRMGLSLARVWLSNDSFSRPSCSIGSLLYPMVALVPSLLVEDNGSREAPPPLLAAGRLPRRTGASRGIAPDDRLRAQAARAGDRARDAVGRRL